MGELSRREAVKSLASGTIAGVALGGAVGGTAASALAAAGPARTGGTGTQAISTGLAIEVRDVAGRLAITPTIGAGAVVGEAQILAIRSWSREVYLHLGDTCRGMVTLSETGLAIVAACKAAGRPVAACVWGHEPDFAGVGRFGGAVVAMDVADLPPIEGGARQF